MKLIDKDALVSEIERLVSNGKLKCQQAQENNDHESYVAWSEHIATCGKILSSLDILEVKEIFIDLGDGCLMTPYEHYLCNIGDTIKRKIIG